MLKKIFLSLIFASLAQTAMADGPLRVLYMEVDGGQRHIHKNHPAYRHIFEETGDFLEDRAGMRLIGERPFEKRRTFKEARFDAEQINPDNVDAIVMVSVKRNMKRDQNMVKNRLVAVAHVLDPHSLDVMDQVRIKSPVARIDRFDCSKECRQLIAKRHVMKILPRFKKQLAKSIHESALAPKELSKKTNAKARNYTLTLKGFNDREIRFLEDRIVRLDGTKDLSSLRSNSDKPAFWLERRKNAENIRDDLSDVLARLDLQARIIETPKMITLIKQKRNLAYLD